MHNELLRVTSSLILVLAFENRAKLVHHEIVQSQFFGHNWEEFEFFLFTIEAKVPFLVRMIKPIDNYHSNVSTITLWFPSKGCVFLANTGNIIAQADSL